MKKRWPLLGLAAGLSAYLSWTVVGRAPLPQEFDPRLVEVVGFGEDEGRGALVAVQPWVRPTDYAGIRSFERVLDASLAVAERRGLLSKDPVVVLPEHVGTWLVAAREKRGVREAATMEEALRLLAASNGPAYAAALAVSFEADATTAAAFRMKAPVMAEIYQAVLSALARRHRATIVGGSIILPDPRVEDGRIVVGSGPLYNASFVFRPDGQVEPRVVRAAFLDGDERDLLAAGDPRDLPVFETPAGTLGVLVGEDAWFPVSYDVLGGRGADLIASIAFDEEPGSWRAPWRGYDAAAWPADVDLQDVGALTREEAWLKHGLPRRLPSSGARAGVHAALRGALWDVGDDGRSFAIRDSQVFAGPHVDGAVVLGLWLADPARPRGPAASSQAPPPQPSLDDGDGSDAGVGAAPRDAGRAPEVVVDAGPAPAPRVVVDAGAAVTAPDSGPR